MASGKYYAVGLDVLPEYRGQGLGRELVYQYLRRERGKDILEIFLTCLKTKVKMFVFLFNAVCYNNI